MCLKSHLQNWKSTHLYENDLAILSDRWTPTLLFTDINLTACWIFLFVTGVLVQLYLQKGRPPFPPNRSTLGIILYYDSIVHRNEERTPLLAPTTSAVPNRSAPSAPHPNTSAERPPPYCAYTGNVLNPTRIEPKPVASQANERAVNSTTKTTILKNVDGITIRTEIDIKNADGNSQERPRRHR